jgi:adenosylcobinamide-GDP ribazoletransferase
MIWMKGFLISLQFFTSIPLRFAFPMDHKHLEKVVQTFPLLGLLQGGIYAGVLYALVHGTPLSPLAIAFLLWLLMIVLTGGIHLDGWVDVSDAFFSYRDQERRLEIMKDPRVGAFGVLSLLVVLSGRFLFLYELILHIKPVFYYLILLIPFLGKGIMGVFLVNIKTAKSEGLGSLFQNATRLSTLWIYPFYVLAVAGGGVFIMKEALVGVSLFLLVTFIILLVFPRKIIQWFGGITGDVVGASAEGTEWLLWMTLWLWHYYAMA